MKRKRSSTVEPVWGTLINFTGIKRLNARGLKAANKMLLLAATVYNLKKWLRFITSKTSIKGMALVQTKCRKGVAAMKNTLFQFISRPIVTSIFSVYQKCVLTS